MLLSLVHNEFAKYALRYWDTYSPEQQTKYLELHPKSRKYPTDNPHNIAKRLGIIYEGYQSGLRKFFFRDPLTQTSFCANNLEEAEFKLEEKQKLFLDKPLKHAATIRAEYKEAMQQQYFD